jgi:hypothetical protein
MVSTLAMVGRLPSLPANPSCDPPLDGGVGAAHTGISSEVIEKSSEVVETLG